LGSILTPIRAKLITMKKYVAGLLPSVESREVLQLLGT
jgi:hypothetical protein